MKERIKSFIKLFCIFFAALLLSYYFNLDENTNKQEPKLKEKTINNEINKNDDLLEIYYLNVGEADSTYIHYKDYDLLIDAGNTVDGKNIVAYLKELGVESLDYVFATHAHEDHMGGMHWIIYKFKVNNFYMPNHPAEWKSYENLMKALKDENVELKEPTIDQELTLEDLKLKVLWVGNSEDYNENSIVLKLTYKDRKFLFMADATTEVESKLLDKDIDSDVLKVGHHGSRDATSANFIYKVNPKYAIISVGKDNEYNHPHQVTLDKLNKLNSVIYRTDQDNTIHLTSDGKGIYIESIDKNLNGGDIKDK